MTSPLDSFVALTELTPPATITVFEVLHTPAQIPLFIGLITRDPPTRRTLFSFRFRDGIWRIIIIRMKTGSSWRRTTGAPVCVPPAPRGRFAPLRADACPSTASTQFRHEPAALPRRARRACEAYARHPKAAIPIPEKWVYRYLTPDMPVHAGLRICMRAKVCR